MTLDSLNAFTVTVALQSVLWKYRFSYNNQIQTNGEDQDKMLQCVAFNQGLHYLLR